MRGDDGDIEEDCLYRCWCWQFRGVVMEWCNTTHTTAEPIITVGMSHWKTQRGLSVLNTMIFC